MMPLARRRRLQTQLDGTVLASTDRPPHCTGCGAILLGDAPVTAYAYRFSDEPRFSLARLYCAECDRQHIGVPTLGAVEALVGGRLTSDGDEIQLSRVTPLAYSAPEEGSRNHY